MDSERKSTLNFNIAIINTLAKISGELTYQPNSGFSKEEFTQLIKTLNTTAQELGRKIIQYDQESHLMPNLISDLDDAKNIKSDQFQRIHGIYEGYQQLLSPLQELSKANKKIIQDFSIPEIPVWRKTEAEAKLKKIQQLDVSIDEALRTINKIITPAFKLGYLTGRISIAENKEAKKYKDVLEFFLKVITENEKILSTPSSTMHTSLFEPFERIKMLLKSALALPASIPDQDEMHATLLMTIRDLTKDFLYEKKDNRLPVKQLVSAIEKKQTKNSAEPPALVKITCIAMINALEGIDNIGSKRPSAEALYANSISEMNLVSGKYPAFRIKTSLKPPSKSM